MGLTEIRKAANRAEGFLSDSEGMTLYRLAKKCNGTGAIVEIGSWKGRSTIWIAFGSKDGPKKKVVAIDPHTGSPEMPPGHSLAEFKANIKNAGVGDLVKPIVKTSEEAAASFKEKVGFIFIDGNHDYKYAKQDFGLWFPKVMEHGVMAFHDTNFVRGPKRVVNELVFGSRNFRNIGFADSITFAEKVGANTLSDRLRNRRVQLLKEFFTWASVLNAKAGLPKPLKLAGKKLLKALQ